MLGLLRKNNASTDYYQVVTNQLLISEHHACFGESLHSSHRLRHASSRVMTLTPPTVQLDTKMPLSCQVFWGSNGIVTKVIMILAVLL